MQSYEDRLRRVIRYIYENPAGDLSLDRLADVAAFSRFHWHRIFHAMTGETCAEAVRRVRVTRAADWLATCADPVEDVAARVGYDNAQSFARAFRDVYGMTPAEFRRSGATGAPTLVIRQVEQGMYQSGIQDLSGHRGRVSELVEIVRRRNLRVNHHPPNRRRQPPGRSRHDPDYRHFQLSATGP